ncbi:imelysin family protein [Brumimicrobium mesophilum]|uniref:imelysin family protein n=1 Tax=Brumimicrobium mesophilum TaxID=392717 RepID=UPI000D14492C|nr:imelysin family protein [Brumimicrobium mesophilum]
MLKRSVGYVLLLSVALLFSCKDKVGKDEDNTPFNKGDMLKNVSANIILPSLSQFDADISELKSSFITFKNDPTSANLEEVKMHWKSGYLTWQTLKIFDFGPIRNIGFKSATGTYPVDASKIQSNINAGTYNLASASNLDAIGLSALDYLLFNDQALSEFQTNAAYVVYTDEVIQKLSSETQTIVNGWSTYRGTFNESTGTSSTSAFSEFVNEFNRDYELAKTAKIGIPIGKANLGLTNPEYVEARYSGISFELLVESVKALKVTYNGSGGLGFDDYLVNLERTDLDDIINDKFDIIISKAEGFSMTLEQAINDPSMVNQLDELYLHLQQQVVNIKTDMTAAFGVLITYQDNDGD